MEEASRQKRAALRELSQDCNNDMRNYVPSIPPPLSFRSPSPPPPSKRRRLIQKKRLTELGIVGSTGLDNDKVDDEKVGNDQSLYTLANTSTNTSQATDIAEEIDKGNGILAILSRDEVAFGDAIGDDRDEDFIPGPDDEGSDEDNNREATADLLLSSDEIAASSSGGIAVEGSMNLPAASTPALQMLDDICKANFKHRIRTAITSLKEFAKGIKYNPTQQGGPTYPLSYSFWFLLCRVSTDDLMESYIAAIPQKVQVLFGRDYIIPKSILALDGDWKHYHLSKGVYVNLPFDKLANVYKCYIGSTCRTLHRRISEHMRIARSIEISDDNAKSLHYSYICKPSVAQNFRVIAAFPSRAVPDGYVQLLEAIMMIFFQSYCRPQHQSRFMNSESYDLMETIRIDTGIPQVQWTGLNAAWPAVQGFRMNRMPCTNKVCFGKVPHSIGFTLCYICNTFKTTKGRLPTSVEISWLMSEGQKLEAARAKAGPNAPCGDCGRREYSFADRHLMHHLAPGLLLCGACVMQLKTHGVMHTAEERAKLVGVSALVFKRRTEEILCDNCAVSESSQLTRQHIYNAEVGRVLCSACDSYRRMFSNDRDPSLEIGRQAFQDMKKQREGGTLVTCQQCNATEPPKAKHHYNTITSKVLCKACDLYHRKHGKDRDVSKEIRRQGMIDVKRRRKEGILIHCDQCNTAEPPGATHNYNAKLDKVLCNACDSYNRRHSQDRDVSKETRRIALDEIKKKRADGIQLYCDECSRAETLADTGRKRFSCSGENNRLLCMTCGNKAYNAAAKAKKAEKGGVRSGT